jgi:hypothetical protein
VLLQCEIEYGDGEGSWLRAETLASLSELNEECLELLAQQARVPPGSATLAEIARHWVALDAAGRRRASGCLYLLLDAGFADPQRWHSCASAASDEAGRDVVPFFTVAAAPQLAQGVFTFAWHLARCQASAARLLLGMPGASVGSLARHTLSQVRALALANPHWLRPRWALRPVIWREFLTAAASGDPATLERVRLRGQRLLAAEARHALSRPPGAGLRALRSAAVGAARELRRPAGYVPPQTR